MAEAADKTLCVFTPSYNRAWCLPALYESLCQQTCLDFHWLIVDDGSSDNTATVIEKLSEQAPFPITYLYQENGGKQRAHNTGVAACPNPLFVCVDSDDIMPPDAVESFLTAWQPYRHDEHVAGVIALCGKDQTTPWGNGWLHDIPLSTMWDLYYRFGHRGDTSIMHRTSVLRETPFKVVDGEKFVAETAVYHEIDQKYQLAVLNKVVIIRTYLDDGYSSNMRKITRENPIGYAEHKRKFIEYSDTFPLKTENTILYLVGCHFSHKPKAIRSAPYPGIALLAWLPAKVLCYTVYSPKRDE